MVLLTPMSVWAKSGALAIIRAKAIIDAALAKIMRDSVELVIVDGIHGAVYLTVPKLGANLITHLNVIAAADNMALLILSDGVTTAQSLQGA